MGLHCQMITLTNYSQLIDMQKPLHILVFIGIPFFTFVVVVYWLIVALVSKILKQKEGIAECANSTYMYTRAHTFL